LKLPLSDKDNCGGIMAMGPDNNLYISVGDLDGTFRGANIAFFALWLLTIIIMP
jgi:hypothetical protein